MPNSEEELRRIAGEIEACTRCALSRTRIKPVLGEGPPKAQVMFVGEAPGRNEDIEGRPFVGRAGDLLNELLASIRLNRESVYVTNIVKCRPTTASQPVEQQPHEAKDRRPTSEEIATYTPYLEEQLDLVRPKVICTLARLETQRSTRRDQGESAQAELSNCILICVDVFITVRKSPEPMGRRSHRCL